MDQENSSLRISTISIPSSPPRRRRSSNAQAGPSGPRKRRRLTNQTVSSSGSQPENPDETIESIDLTEVDGNSAIAKVLAKQREDAVASQHLTDSGNARTKLTAYKCPVCMDTPIDATTTVCGTSFFYDIQSSGYMLIWTRTPVLPPMHHRSPQDWRRKNRPGWKIPRYLPRMSQTARTTRFARAKEISCSPKNQTYYEEETCCVNTERGFLKGLPLLSSFLWGSCP
jgi:hypothetical protein